MQEPATVQGIFYPSYFSLVPRLSVDKTYLSMKSFICQISQSEGFLYFSNPVVTITNEGSATVFYEWKKIIRKDHIESKHSDCIQRFYCHYVFFGYIKEIIACVEIIAARKENFCIYI